jgi:putative membrane protein
MKRSDLLWYQQNTRQAPIAMLMILFGIVKSLIRTWWPFILILIFRANFITRDSAVLLTGSVTILVIIASVWQYFRFYFFLSSNKLHVHKGVFTRAKLDVPFDRIQSITFEQNIIHQLFKVVRVKIDTAGSSGEEFEFTALDLEKANKLRSFILSRKTVREVEPVVTASPARVLLSLDIPDLLRVGISQNHLRTTGIVVAFLLGLRDRIRDSLGDRYVDKFDTVTDRLFENIVVYGVGLFVSILILSFFGTLIYSVLQYYDLRLWKTVDGYKMESGLFNRREQVVRNQKIQIIRWVSNPIRDIFSIVQLRFFQASSAVGSSKTSITVPGVPRNLMSEILTYYLGKKGVSLLGGTGYTVDKSYFTRRFIYLVFVPCLGFLVLIWLTGFVSWLVVMLLWFLVGGYFQYHLQKKWRYDLDNSGVMTISGVLERVHRVLLLQKVQGVQIKQSPYQYRHGLSTIILHSASGDIKIPYIKMEMALRIKNYVLYKVESSRQKWM